MQSPTISSFPLNKSIKEPIDIDFGAIQSIIGNFDIDLTDTPEKKINVEETPIKSKAKTIEIYSPYQCKSKLPIINVKPIGVLNSNTLEFNTKISDTIENNKIQKRGIYSNLSEYDKISKKIFFNEKFEILKENFPEWNIKLPDDSYSLDQIHDVYDNYIKRIAISIQCGEWKSMLAILLLMIEFCALKFCKIDIRGFAKAEMRKTNKYNRILHKLGEERYNAEGGESSAMEELIKLVGLNIIIFVFMKYVAPYIGGDASMEIIQNVLNNFIDNDNSSTLEKFQISEPTKKENTNESNSNSDSNSDSGSNLGNILTSIVGNSKDLKSGDYSNILTSIGSFASTFLGNTNNNNNTTINKPTKKKINW